MAEKMKIRKAKAKARDKKGPKRQRTQRLYKRRKELIGPRDNGDHINHRRAYYSMQVAGKEVKVSRAESRKPPAMKIGWGITKG